METCHESPEDHSVELFVRRILRLNRRIARTRFQDRFGIGLSSEMHDFPRPTLMPELVGDHGALPVRRLQDGANRRSLTADRRGVARVIWTRNSPSWRFDEATFERTAMAFDNPDYVDVVIHSHRHRLGRAPGYPPHDMRRSNASLRHSRSSPSRQLLWMTRLSISCRLPCHTSIHRAFSQV